MEYKFVELMSLQYTRSAEDVVQHQITYRYNAMKVRCVVGVKYTERGRPSHEFRDTVICVETNKSGTLDCREHVSLVGCCCFEDRNEKTLT